MNKIGTDALSKVFGDSLKPIILQQSNQKRVSLTASTSDRVGAYSIVKFKNGTSAFPELHQRILDGALIGKTFRDAQIPFRRDEKCSFIYPAEETLKRLFDSNVTECFVKEVDFLVGDKEVPYASITEVYSPLVSFPDLFEREKGRVGSVRRGLDRELSSKSDYIIRKVEDYDLEKYLGLAHGFLKKPIHTGIEDKYQFVDSLRETGKMLLRDQNTVLLIAQHNKKLVGYLAANIHPALHVNGKECMIRELYVEEKFRRKGIATSLVKTIERLAKEKGAKRVSLATNWTDNLQQGFYSDCGYHRRCDFVVKYLGGQNVS